MQSVLSSPTLWLTLVACALSLAYLRWGPDDSDKKWSRLQVSQGILGAGAGLVALGSVLSLIFSKPSAQILEFTGLSFNPSGELVVACRRKFESVPEERFWLVERADGRVDKLETYRTKFEQHSQYAIWDQAGRAGDKRVVTNATGDLELPVDLDPLGTYRGTDGVLCYSSVDLVWWTPSERHKFASNYSPRGGSDGKLVLTQTLNQNGERVVLLDPKGWKETRLAEYPAGKAGVSSVVEGWVILQRDGVFWAYPTDGGEPRRFDGIDRLDYVVESPDGKVLLGIGMDQSLELINMADFKVDLLPAPPTPVGNITWLGSELLVDTFNHQLYSIQTKQWNKLERPGEGEWVLRPDKAEIYSLRKRDHWSGTVDVHNFQGTLLRSLSARELLNRAESTGS